MIGIYWSLDLWEENLQYIKKRISIIIVIIVLVALFGSLIYVFWPYFPAFFDPEQARKIIISAGAWGPVVFIIFQILQVLIAPIPGPVAGLVGGYLFGPFFGILYTMIGATNRFYPYFCAYKKIWSSICRTFNQ